MFEKKPSAGFVPSASWSRFQAGALTLALMLPAFTTAPVAAKPEVVEWVKYLNPVPEKTYLNESQDRLIKKKKFKLDSLPDTAPIANKEQGFFAIVGSEDCKDTSKLDDLLARPDVNGLSVILPWSLLAPREDDYNWKPLDSLITSCEKHNKSLILRISSCGIDLLSGLSVEDAAKTDCSPESSAITPPPSDSPAEIKHPAGESGTETVSKVPAQDSAGIKTGKAKTASSTFVPENNTALFAKSDTPEWVYKKGIKSIRYIGADGNLHLMPIFWDQTYLATWSNFIEDLAERYDKNPNIHSIGITGGGVAGGTGVIPNLLPKNEGQTVSNHKTALRNNAKELTRKLTEVHGMNQRQLVEHWKYVSDLFLNAFPNARLNFDIDPPTNDRKGQTSLDEISDYLIYRYGQRVYLTRQNVSNGKHGFDQYRVLLKFRPDTLTGLKLEEGIPSGDFKKLTQSTLDDGISFIEIPPSALLSPDVAVKDFIKTVSSHIGYQLLSKQAEFPKESASGKPLTAKFTFVNLGAASPARPIRNLDKDVASSLRIQIELVNSKDKPAVISLHTPDIPTNLWLAGKPVTWEEDLKMPELAPGKYKIFMSVVDDEHKRTVNFLDAISAAEPTITTRAPVGTIEIGAKGQNKTATKEDSKSSPK